MLALGSFSQYRRFPTVERRAKVLHGDKYISIPADKEWVELVVEGCKGNKVGVFTFVLTSGKWGRV